MLFSIGIPTLNRADLLIPALKNYVLDFQNTDLHIIDNGKQNIDFVHDSVQIYVQEQNIGVAASWNKLCKEIFKTKDWALLVNDDVYLGYTNSRVNMCIEMSETGIVQSEKSWSVLLINKDLYEFIGEFDESFFPAYFEDSDYLYRLRLNGVRQDIMHHLNPNIFRVSQTYEKAPDFVNLAMAVNKQRYIDKWGGLPYMETYTEPFDNKI